MNIIKLMIDGQVEGSAENFDEITLPKLTLTRSENSLPIFFLCETPLAFRVFISLGRLRVKVKLQMYFILIDSMSV